MTSREINPKDYIIKPGATISNVDLDKEEVYFRGERLTEARAEELAEETLAALDRGEFTLEEIRRNSGRPSLTGEPHPSPRLNLRLTPELRDAAERIAKQDGCRVSDVARRALEEYTSKRLKAS